MKKPSIETAPLQTKHSCWIFTHLQKCGGSTIKKMIRQRWGDRRSIYDSPQWLAGNAYTKGYAKNLVRDKRWSVVAGGYTEGLRAPVQGSCKWFTMFRHPVSRLVSAYFYCQELPGDWLCASPVVRAETLTLVEFAQHWGNFAMRQFVLDLVPADDVIKFVKKGGIEGDYENPLKLPGWYLLKKYLENLGDDSGKSEAEVMSGMLHPTRDLLSFNFSAVGILENFNTTLDLFDAALEMPNMNWRSAFESAGVMNVDKAFISEKGKALQSAWIDSDIKEYISLDLLLYEHALDVFKAQVKLYGLK